MLLKWQSEGSYLKAALSFLRTHSALFEIAHLTYAGTTIFKLVEEKVATEERFALTKACLEADLALPMSDRFATTMWKSFWRAACHSKSWQSAKSLFRSSSGRVSR
jgi:hypothetical protein